MNTAHNASLYSRLLANVSLLRLENYCIYSTNILGHLLFTGNKGLLGLLLLMQEMVYKPVFCEVVLTGKRTTSKKKKKKRKAATLNSTKESSNLSFIQRAADWLSLGDRYIFRSKYSSSGKIMCVCLPVCLSICVLVSVSHSSQIQNGFKFFYVTV